MNKMEINYNLLNRLEKNHGNSFYLFDSKKLLDNYNTLKNSFLRYYPNTKIAYSYKTNYLPKVCSLLNKEGAFSEVVSYFEYTLAKKLNISSEKIIVNGPYKKEEEITEYLLSGCILNLDSFYELEIIEKISKLYPENFFSIGIRCNFEVDSENISRFGFDIESLDFKSIFKRIDVLKNVKIVGLHCHFPNRDLNSFGIRVDRMLTLVDDYFKIPPKYIDIGGGYFGYVPGSLKCQFSVDVPSYEDYAKLIGQKMSKYFSDLDEEKKPILFLEPGSALVGDIMSFVTKIIEIKKVKDKLIAQTTGSRFNLGSFSSKINLPVHLIKKYDNVKKSHENRIYDISGYTCIESDYLYRGFNGCLNIDDYLIFDNVGSYSIVFKPPFILPNVPIIELNLNTKEVLVLKRKENFDDIFRTYNFDDKNA